MLGSFPFVTPSLVGAYYLQPPDKPAKFLHNDLLCNDTCSVTGGSITYWGGGGGGHKRKRSKCCKVRDLFNFAPQHCGLTLFTPPGARVLFKLLYNNK